MLEFVTTLTDCLLSLCVLTYLTVMMTLQTIVVICQYVLEFALELFGVLHYKCKAVNSVVFIVAENLYKVPEMVYNWMIGLKYVNVAAVVEYVGMSPASVFG